ncbi:hypothetical protein CEXT_81971 [Caerostris extrusa]|uniref:Uncharacterized protein n=1 Tax=Caerostris extrusa TaxID=172846 RepID=A0AAV4NK50_CAEEX|nr:hypothetical protein CEXT_81971 [Caerostris extrusa]
MLEDGLNVIQLGPDDPFIHASPEDCLERFRRNESTQNAILFSEISPKVTLKLSHRIYKIGIDVLQSTVGVGQISLLQGRAAQPHMAKHCY